VKAKVAQPRDNSVSAEELESYYRDMPAHLPLRRAGGQLYGMGLIRRLLPSLYRPGSGRRRQQFHDQAGGRRHHLLSRSHGHMLARGWKRAA